MTLSWVISSNVSKSMTQPRLARGQLLEMLSRVLVSSGTAITQKGVRTPASLGSPLRGKGFPVGEVGTIQRLARHAFVELAIRDLKEGAGLDHVPSGSVSANTAYPTTGRVHW